MINSFMLKEVILLLLFVLSNFFLIASDPNLDEAGEHIKNFSLQTGASIATYDIPLGDSYTGGAITWSICLDPDGTEADCTYDIVNFPDGSTTSDIEVPSIVDANDNLIARFSNAGVPSVQIRINNSVPVGEYFVRIRAIRTSDPTSYNQTRAYRIIVRQPRDFLLVLDMSGSMGCSASDPIDCSSDVEDPRWLQVREGMTSFLNSYVNPEDELVDADRFRVFYFSNDAVTASIINDTYTGPSTLSAFKDALEADIEGHPKAGATSIGAGLIEAIENVGGSDDDSRSQTIILFTDGHQNTDPSVTTDSEGEVNLIDYITTTAPRGFSPVNFSSGTYNNFRILAFSALSSPPDNGLLSELSEDLIIEDFTGETRIGSRIAGEGFNIFNEGNTPNFIKSETQELNNTNRLEITVNKNVKSLFFDAFLDLPRIEDYSNISITRNGVSVTDSVFNLVRGSYFVKFVYNCADFSDEQCEGNWVFEMNRNRSANRPPANNVRLTATADDPAIDMVVSTYEKKPVLGGKLLPTVELTCNGGPIETAKVTAKIYKPKDDLNDILARTVVPASFNAGPDSSCSIRAYNYLQKTNPAVLEPVINPSVETITLRYNKSKKVYCLPYRNLDVVGSYKVEFFVEANVPRLGKVVRTKEENVFVKFNKVKLEEKEVDTGTQTTNLQFIPTYTFNGRKRLAGPGWGYAFKSSGNGISNARISNSCGGQYNMTLDITNNDPNLQLKVFDETVYRGDVSRFPRTFGGGGFFENLYGKVYGGLTFPGDGFEGTIDNGFLVELGLGYPVQKNLMLETYGGYYGFQNDYNILGWTTLLKYQFTLPNLVVSDRNLVFSVGAGGGIYSPKDLSATSGYLGKASVRYPISRTSAKTGFDLEFEFGAHFLSEPDVQFINTSILIIKPF